MTIDPDHPDSILAYYEGNAKEFYDATVNINVAVLYPPFLSYMPPYASILDAGCGSGRDTKFFAGRGYRVTAFDFAPTLVKLASKLTGQEVLRLSFEDLEFDNQFNGVWACSSFLHLPMDELHDVFSKLSKSMKVNGVMYTSFNYGTGKQYRDGIPFMHLDEDSFNELIKRHHEFTIIRSWESSDLRPDRADEKWLNLLLRKTKASE
jgi:SAM-dependent methyltransferase